MSKDGITLAWAHPVDPLILGTRVQAYFEFSQRITALSDCCSRIKAKLPVEIWNSILDTVEEDLFEAILKDWLPRHQCVTNTCEASEHLDEDELKALNLDRVGPLFKPEYEKWMRRRYSSRHGQTFWKYLPRYKEQTFAMQEEAIKVRTLNHDMPSSPH